MTELSDRELDEAIGRATAARPDADRNWELGRLLVGRFERSGDEGDLRAGTVLLEQALDDGEGDWWSEACVLLGRARTALWNAHHDSADLGQAIRCFHVLVQEYAEDDDFPPVLLAELGHLLHDRAMLGVESFEDADGADLADAATLLGTAAQRVLPDDPARYGILGEAVLAWLNQYRRTGDPEDFRLADDLARALIEAGADEERRDAALGMRAALHAHRHQADPELPVDEEVMRTGYRAMIRFTDDDSLDGTSLVDALPLRARHIGGTDPGAALVAMRDTIDRMPVGSPERAAAATAAAAAHMMVLRVDPAARLDLPWLDSLLVEALAHGEHSQERGAALKAYLGVIRVARSAHERMNHTTDAVRLIQDALGEVAPNTRLAAGMRSGLMMARHARHELGSGISDADDAILDADSVVDDSTMSPYARLLIRASRASVEASRAYRYRDADTMDRCIAELRACVDELAPDDVARPEVLQHLVVCQVQRSSLTDDPASRALMDSSVGLLDGPMRHGQGDPNWSRFNDALTRLCQATQRREVAGMGPAIDDLRRVVAETSPEDSNYVRYLCALGSGCCCQGQVLGNRSIVDEGVRWLEQAWERIQAPGQTMWSQVARSLAFALRQRGDRTRRDQERSRELGFQSLRAHAWTVLLQSGSDHATVAGRDAARDAIEVGGWCLADLKGADTLRALDSGRGLVLHAAMAKKTTADQLVEAGHPDLARQWRTQDGDTDDAGLRQQVLRALVGEDLSTGGSRLLDPPGVEEIAEALRTAGADALVYLVPKGEDCPATAVYVTAAGVISAVRLPNLGERTDVLDSYLSAVGGDLTRDMTPVSQVVRDDEGTPLHDVCRWAWYAAMLDLIEAMAEEGVVGPPRLVLVPMGSLALVPWHAAWHRVPGEGIRYAVQDCVVSYAASARLFCDVHAREPIPRGGASLVVGNPTGDLRHAGVESAAIRDRFYPLAPYYGLRADTEPDGEGTSEEILSWLAQDRPDHCDVLHLACHGVVRTTGALRSYLSLAGGAELSAEDLVDGARLADVRTVVLAACSTGASGRGYDEAFSLGTAFLVAGARSVVASLWPVPDEATSLLMFMLHHHLALAHPPADALRRAQLWMVDPERTVPDSMPEVLASAVARIDPHDLSAWSGFVHFGQ